MHARLFPKKNIFKYGGYYTALDLSHLNNCALPVNRRGLVAFHTSDHGAKNAHELQNQIRAKLHEFGISVKGKTLLISMPRIFGYVFNPVSFYLCFDEDEKLRAYVAQVNNTFGEEHFYVCAKSDQSEIDPGDVIEGQKFFHVSPFLAREGRYEFRVQYDEQKAGFWIDYFDAQGRKKLITALTGDCQNMTRENIRRVNFKYPLTTVKTIVLIHWQAIKLWLKKIRFYSKPQPIDPNVTGTIPPAARRQSKEGMNK